MIQAAARASDLCVSRPRMKRPRQSRICISRWSMASHCTSDLLRSERRAWNACASAIHLQVVVASARWAARARVAARASARARADMAEAPEWEWAAHKWADMAEALEWAWAEVPEWAAWVLEWAAHRWAAACMVATQ